MTTRDAGDAAVPGQVVGVDVSERMLEHARWVTAKEGRDNVRVVSWAMPRRSHRSGSRSASDRAEHLR